MIKGFLDNDLYKFTMQQAVWRYYGGHDCEYTLINRGKAYEVNDAFISEFRTQLEKLTKLRLTPAERRYLNSLPYFDDDYLNMLEQYRFNPDEVKWNVDSNNHLLLKITGPWDSTILWEVPLLAIISESYFRCAAPITFDNNLREYRERSLSKGQIMIQAGCRFADFGTRRRYSLEHQKEMIQGMVEADKRSDGDGAFTGTSNVHFARESGIPPIGTVAHEWIMAHEVMHDVENANRKAMQQWIKLYSESAATALSDTFTTALFLDNFDEELAKNKYDSVRQDSGNPESFLENLINHYENLGINPAEKGIIFSDGLSPERCVQLHQRVDDRMRDAYGIGTNLTNDVPGNRPLDIVIKMTGFDGEPAVKIPDDRSKATGDREKCERLIQRIEKYLNKNLLKGLDHG